MSNDYKFELGKRYLVKELSGYLQEFDYKVGDIIDTGSTCARHSFNVDPDGDLRLLNGDEGWKYGRPFLYTSSLEGGYMMLLEDSITETVPYNNDQNYSAMDMSFNKGCAFWHVINAHKNVDNKVQSVQDMKSAIWHLEQEILRLEKPIEQV